MKKILIVFTLIASLVVAVLPGTAQTSTLPTPNSCGKYVGLDGSIVNPETTQYSIVGKIYTFWNCGLQDTTYLYFLSHGQSEYSAANLASQAVQRDSVDRLNDAMEDLRARLGKEEFDSILAQHGLSFHK